MKIYYNCGEKCHISPNFLMPGKRKKKSKLKHRQESSDEEEDEKPKPKSFGKKNGCNDKNKLFPKKKMGDGYKRSFMVEKQK